MPKESQSLMKYSQFSTCKERDYMYAKDELCIKLISLLIDKFNETKENSIGMDEEATPDIFRYKTRCIYF